MYTTCHNACQIYRKKPFALKSILRDLYSNFPLQFNVDMVSDLLVLLSVPVYFPYDI